jgi:hypothetical protein
MCVLVALFIFLSLCEYVWTHRQPFRQLAHILQCGQISTEAQVGRHCYCDAVRIGASLSQCLQWAQEWLAAVKGACTTRQSLQHLGNLR